jgi:hypothetical protein
MTKIPRDERAPRHPCVDRELALVSLLALATSAPAVGDPGAPELALRHHLHQPSGAPHADDTASAEGKRPWNNPEGQP